MYTAIMKTSFMIIAVLAILVMTTTTATNVSASSNCAQKSFLAELACEGQGVLSAYNQGEADGKQAAINGQSNECPQSDSLSGYCLGFGSGWNKITYAQKELNSVQSSDDGEFIDTPKRTISGGDD